MSRFNKKSVSQKKNSSIQGKSREESVFNKKILFSFKDINFFQAKKENFNTWSENNLLVKLMDKITEVSKLTVNEAKKQQVIKIYGDFPPSSKTKYKKPVYLENGLQWGVMHIQGKEVIAGYLVENIFYIVFLDKDHLFWISEKKNT